MLKQPEGPEKGPLDDIRVVEMATMMAGPYGATLLGDLGADVIKLESPRGDDSRHLGPQRDGQRSSFLSLNRNKRGLMLDLARPAAREAFERLARTIDVFITNIREPALSRLGLGCSRNHRSYLVAVRNRLYWPVVRHLRPDTSEARS